MHWRSVNVDALIGGHFACARVLTTDQDLALQIEAWEITALKLAMGVRQDVAFTRFARAYPALFRLMFGPQHGHAESAAINRADDALKRRASELAPTDSATAKLACRALVRGLTVIEASGRLAPVKARRRRSGS